MGQGTNVQEVVVPRYYEPRPYQRAAWNRRDSGKYDYYFKIWSRQAGKDADDRAWLYHRAWKTPGSQSVYVGIDNNWIKENVFLKLIDGRSADMDYPREMIDVASTERRVSFLNHPPDKAPATIKFIGFKNENGIIGASYDNFVITETGLFPDGAFDYIEPIWENKQAMGLPLNVGFNGTPRGQRSVFFKTLQAYTGKDDPEDFPGEHDYNGKKVYVDVLKAPDIVLANGERLYSEERLENLKARHMRQHGNLNLFNQEYMVDFLTVNAGLVYQGIEVLEREGRYREFNLDTSKPVYVAWDLSSKASRTDWTSGIVFQWIANQMFIFDYIEDRGKPFAEVVSQLASRDYWQYVRACILPWDAERSYSSVSATDEVERLFPQVNWHTLSKETVMRGINEVRKKLPNMYINKQRCDWVMTCFNNYEFKSLAAEDDWVAVPKHGRHSHLMDAIRYAVMGINEIAYLRLNDDGSYNNEIGHYKTFWEDEKEELEFIPGTAFTRPKKQPGSNIEVVRSNDDNWGISW